jgi:integrase
MDLALPQPDNKALSTPLENLGQAANQAASGGTFADYQRRKAFNTLRRQTKDLNLFAEYLESKGVTVGDLASEPAAWRGITWGLVKAFMMWMLNQGYATATVNMRISTVKVYAKLAAQAGEIPSAELALILTVTGYRQKEARRIDKEREAHGVPTRTGRKKAQWVSLTAEQARQLKTMHADTPQGRRDALILCLLLDHGLRVGEVSGLQVTDFDLRAGELRFYRPKVDKTQTHRLSRATLQAAKAYFTADAPAMGPLLRGSRKGGKLTESGMSEQAITERVRILGEQIGVPGLSAHDCRHFWATHAARNRTPLDRLQDAGGWNSPAMPMRYIEAAKIANMGVNLGEEEE